MALMPYSQQERERLLDAVEHRMEHEGRGLREACRAENIPHPTILRWIKEDEAADDAARENGRVEKLSDQFARARSRLLELVAADIIEIADDVSDDPASRRVRVDTRLKVYARLAPKRWGERVRNEIAGDPDAPLRTVRELSEAELMAIAAGNGRGDSGA